MLKVARVVPVLKEEIEIDQFIPLKIRWNQYIFGEDTIYWRTGDLKKTMLELGIAKTGELRKLTIVSAGKSYFCDIKPIECKNSEDGVPVFNVDDWENCNKIDHISLFDVQYCNDKINILFSENCITKTIISKRVVFGIDEYSTICKVMVLGLSKEESAGIRTMLEG